MKKAYKIDIHLSKQTTIERQVAFLRNVFVSREIEFLYNENSHRLSLLFYSDGVDDLQKIFKNILNNQYNFKNVGIRKLTLKNKITFHPTIDNSVVFATDLTRFEWIEYNKDGYLGFTDNDELMKVKFEDIELPERIYKYRGWTREEHKRVLTHSELYFAPPSSFGDHHECNLPLRHDLVTSTRRRKWLLNSSKQINPNFSKKKHKKFVEHQIKKSLYNDPEHRKKVEHNFKQNLDKILGVLSLTPVKNNPEMWEVFGEKHTGICVGFDSKKLFESDEAFAHAGPVKYYDPESPPIIMPFQLSSSERIKAAHINIFSLPNYWEYEQEYRISKLYLKNRAIRFNKDSIIEIILGSDMNEDCKNEVVKIIRKEYPNIDVFQSVRTELGPYELRKIDI